MQIMIGLFFLTRQLGSKGMSWINTDMHEFVVCIFVETQLIIWLFMKSSQ